MKRPSLLLLVMLLCLIPLLPAAAQGTAVQAVLFYSPTCPHCHQVITVNLPQISQQFNTSVTWSYYGEGYDPTSDATPPLVALQGDALQVLYVDTTTEVGNELFSAAIDRFEVPSSAWVVPFMIIGDSYFTGDIEIPEQLPLILEAAKEQGGIAWPDIPGLDGYLAQLQLFPDQTPSAGEATPTQDAAAPTPSAAPETPAAPPILDRTAADLSIGERIMLDPAGNTLAIVVLIGMLLSLVAVSLRWSGRFGPTQTVPLSNWVPALAILGLGVAGYLAYIAATGNTAACGPVGDCNTVAQSEYSTLLFGISNGALGVAGYVLILIGWLAARFAGAKLATWAKLGIFAAALGGCFFSIYLTTLEPFVIGASCAWCLTSAVLITALMLLSAGPARTAFHELRQWA
jgi:uncharacterized membrane protein